MVWIWSWREVIVDELRWRDQASRLEDLPGSTISSPELYSLQDIDCSNFIFKETFLTAVVIRDTSLPSIPHPLLAAGSVCDLLTIRLSFSDQSERIACSYSRNNRLTLTCRVPCLDYVLARPFTKWATNFLRKYLPRPRIPRYFQSRDAWWKHL